ncbi:hypothetical protein QOZ80_6AG0508390 [Eleusine coracana subsp. coracana]|nr:hypothetical protein QOZ80_6AG0508390 [Eleusine coracana subsp. coracana]
MEPSGVASILNRVVLVLLLLAGAGSGALVHKTIESDDGDVIDCVDAYQQPALIKYQDGSRKLAAGPERSMKDMVAAANASKPQARHQTWRKHGSCPAGTVPIRRESNPVKISELLAGQPSPFGHPGSYSLSATQLGGSDNASAMAVAPPGVKIEVAAAYATRYPYMGIRAEIPYWKVDVQNPQEFSMSYIMLGYTLDPKYQPAPMAAPPTNLTNQIAVGLVNDGGAANKCFNHECEGFHIKEGARYAIGSWWHDSDSQVGGVRYAVSVGIHVDQAVGNWWVSVLDDDIGYYPEHVFNTRFHDGCYAEIGGRVLDTRPGGLHTTTPMGSGQPASAGWRFAATIMEYYGITLQGALFRDQADRTVVTTPTCYGVNPLGFDKNRGGYAVSYGGPGGIYCDRRA